MLRMARLYSCATDNKLYRELAQESDAILYLGAPYHQDAYAYGLSVHVGPVTAWRPPLAPNRMRKSFLFNFGTKWMHALRWLRSV